jgi:putative ABC transport system permease protein
VAYATPSLRGGFQVVYANQNWPTAVQGTGVEYPNIFEWPLTSGEWFTSQDIDAASKVAVLGDTVREMLFGSVDPVGQVMQIKNLPFRIIGILEPRGSPPGDRIGTTLSSFPTPPPRRSLARR